MAGGFFNLWKSPRVFSQGYAQAVQNPRGPLEVNENPTLQRFFHRP